MKIKFANAKASFTVTVHEDEAVRIDKLAKRYGQIFEECANRLVAKAIWDVEDIGPTTWDEIRQLEAKSAGE